MYIIKLLFDISAFIQVKNDAKLYNKCRNQYTCEFSLYINSIAAGIVEAFASLTSVKHDKPAHPCLGEPFYTVIT